VRPMLRVNPAEAAPIWRQIEEGVRRLVTSGQLRPGQSVPSVRDLARDLRVNPATVSKAYQHLTDAGLLDVRRGEGTFVAEAPPSMRKAERREALREGAERYASLAVTIGASRGDASEELGRAWENLGGGKKGGQP
jgi:GntR family transcriptional regulator